MSCKVGLTGCVRMATGSLRTNLQCEGSDHSSRRVTGPRTSCQKARRVGMPWDRLTVRAVTTWVAALIAVVAVGIPEAVVWAHQKAGYLSTGDASAADVGIGGTRRAAAGVPRRHHHLLDHERSRRRGPRCSPRTPARRHLR